MRKILIVIMVCITLFANDNEMLKYKIINNKDWQVNAYDSQWAKKITMPEGCDNNSWENKIHQVITISSNIMMENPNTWLNEKYLGFINSRCSLIGTYTLRNTTKEDFDKIVDSFYFKESNISQIEKDTILVNIKQKEQNEFIIRSIFVAILIIVLFRIIQSLSSPKPKLPKGRKTNSRKFFWWLAIWGQQNDRN